MLRERRGNACGQRGGASIAAAIVALASSAARAAALAAFALADVATTEDT